MHFHFLLDMHKECSRMCHHTNLNTFFLSLSPSLRCLFICSSLFFSSTHAWYTVYMILLHVLIQTESRCRKKCTKIFNWNFNSYHIRASYITQPFLLCTIVWFVVFVCVPSINFVMCVFFSVSRKNRMQRFSIGSNSLNRIIEFFRWTMHALKI